MSDKKHLYLVDGSAYIFRAYYSLPPLTNPEGVPVGAILGYTNMLWKLADDLHAADGPTHMAVILDKAGTSFRNEIYDQYKANRPPAPEDLRPQFPIIRDATRAFSLPMVEEENVEADDMIASYTKAAVAAGWKVTIISSDKDLMQLIEADVDMFDTMKDKRIGAEQVAEKFGVGPELVGDMLSLMGDTSDNIPGVPGIGPKTATKLLLEYGSLDEVLAAAPNMKPSKMRDNLIEHEGKARLSRVLVTLKEDCPLPIALDDMELKTIPEGPLVPFLQKHGFKALLKRVGQVSDTDAANKAISGRRTDAAKGVQGAAAPALGQAAKPAPMPPVDVTAYSTITDTDVLAEWLARARTEGVMAFDTETDSLEAVTANLMGFSIAIRPGEAAYVPLAHGGSDMFAEKPLQIGMDEALKLLKDVLEDESILKIGQNLKYDMSVLAQHGLEIRNFDDTMVMSFDLDAGDHGHGMDELAKLWLGHECISYKSVCGTGKKQIPFGEVPLDKATEYAAEDADVTLRLWHHLKLRLAPEKATRVYQLVDRPLVPVIAKMECRGIKVNREQLARLSAEFAEATGALETEIHALAGEEFTIGSPKQLGDILFEKMGLKGGKKGKSGQYSTDQSVLEKLSDTAVKDGNEVGAMITDKVLEWRQLSKLKSTYTDALQEQINPETGRVHTSYSLVGAQTGRLSSTEPNLQNIPIRTEIGRQIRDAFVADDGNVILAADYSQIELRLAAHIANVPQLKAAFAAGTDIHSATAQELFGEVNRDTRAKAKTINFAILYGISRWGLAKRLEVSSDEAQAMIDRYFSRFPGIQDYIQETLSKVREKGFSETLFGRKTHFPRIKSSNGNERQGSERAAINAPIQGTSADIIKRAMVNMQPALDAAGLINVKMLLQVHDELVFELPETDIEQARSVIERIMADAALPLVELSVPLGVEIGTGTSWGDAH